MSEPTARPAFRWQTLSDRTTALLLQLLLWVLLTGFYFAWNSRHNYHFRSPIWPLVLLQLSYAVLLFNALVYLIIPRWLLRGRYGLALAGGLLLTVIYQFWYYAGTQLMALYLPPSSDLLQQMQYFHSGKATVQHFATPLGLLNVVLGPISTILFPIIISFLAYALVVDRRRLALEGAHFKLELSYLKAQLNPQFLFNTLSHLQGLTRTRDARAGDVVLHLADLLRYTLYETDAERVPLNRELEFLDDYLALEQLRYPAAAITHEVAGVVATQQLAPLLLHPFYEQLFMGLAAEAGPVSLASLVQVEGQTLILTLRRKLGTPPVAAYRSASAVVAAERRLQLQYPARHEVRVQESGALLQVYLRLQL